MGVLRTMMTPGDKIRRRSPYNKFVSVQQIMTRTFDMIWLGTDLS